MLVGEHSGIEERGLQRSHMVAVGGNERLCSKEFDLLVELWPALQSA